MAIVLCLALLLCPMVLSASAVGVDYNDLNPDITVDGDNDIVSIDIPLEYYYMEIVEPSTPNVIIHAYGTDTFSAQLEAGKRYDMYFGAFYASWNRLDLTNIPNDTVATFGLNVYYDAPYTIGNSYLNWHYYDKSNNLLSISGVNVDSPAISGSYSVDSVINKPAGTDNGCVYLFFQYFQPQFSGEVNATISSITLTMKISSLVRLQQQTGKTNEILKQVEKQLADQGKTLDEVLQQQQQTNDKLDDIQGSIETLPGQIGDEMQGVIDKEKDEATSSGNKYVDQILSALPDPSTDVLAAMKSLTDATAYTGTDATLPIPAIVLPAVEGLFPETVIWGGTEFDFGDSIAMLPSSLLTLVQSLFTIAIVLYCVYELKGIVSYCLTLRESKGG